MGESSLATPPGILTVTAPTWLPSALLTRARAQCWFQPRCSEHPCHWECRQGNAEMQCQGSRGAVLGLQSSAGAAVTQCWSCRDAGLELRPHARQQRSRQVDADWRPGAICCVTVTHQCTACSQTRQHRASSSIQSGGCTLPALLVPLPFYLQE